MPLNSAIARYFVEYSASFSSTMSATSSTEGFDGPSPAYIVFTSADLPCVVVDD